MKIIKIYNLLILFTVVLNAGFLDSFREGFNNGYYDEIERKKFKQERKKCQDGNARACNDLGVFYSKGLGVSTDLKKALNLYELSCSRGDGAGCYNAGSSYSNGQGVRMDKSAASMFYVKACKGRIVEGCYNLAVLFYKGEGVPKNSNKAKIFSEIACSNGVKQGCELYEKLIRQGH